MEILFNNQGTPMIAYGKRAFYSTYGGPAGAEPSSPKTELDDFITAGEKLIVSPWGDNNDFPKTAEDLIGKTGVLNTGLKFNMKIIIGQGVFPVNVTGYNEDGTEILQVVSDTDLHRFLRSRMVRQYMEKSLRDILKFGTAYPELIPTADGKKISGINVINAKHCRLLEAKNGSIPGVVVSGDWPDAPSDKKDLKVIDLLDQYDPMADMIRRRQGKIKPGVKFVYPLNDPWSNNDYYPLPDWWSAKRSGWIDVANKVPEFLKKAYTNQITWMWHIKIPYAYWDKKFPPNKYKDDKARQDLISKEMDQIEELLTGTENANKAIFTMFEINPQGKPEEQWIIEPLDNKYKSDDKLITSAAANSEILFSLMINPNIMGAGMPGGTYAGNQGGSNIREAFLVNLAMVWLDRQRILDPIEAMLEFNGKKDIELRFRNTILTTLDSGAGTTKNLS